MISLCDCWNYEAGVERCAAIGLKMFILTHIWESQFLIMVKLEN